MIEENFQYRSEVEISEAGHAKRWHVPRLQYLWLSSYFLWTSDRHENALLGDGLSASLRKMWF
jgi:hypothetical protein